MRPTEADSLALARCPFCGVLKAQPIALREHATLAHGCAPTSDPRFEQVWGPTTAHEPVRAIGVEGVA